VLARPRGDCVLLVGDEPTVSSAAEGVGVVERERSLPLLLERGRDLERRRNKSFMAMLENEE